MTRFYIVPVEDEERNLDTRYVGQIRSFPELIQCKDCVWNESKEWVDCHMYGMFGKTLDNYCSEAERKTE